MKSVLLILCLFITSTFALNFNDELDKTLSNPNDSVFVFHITTLWRAHVDYNSYTIRRGENPSTVMWILNTTTGKGVMHDETPTISSVYEVVHFDMFFVTTREGSEELLINALIKSDVGNYYSIIINDAYQQLIFSGPGSNAGVVREYNVVSSGKGTAKELYNVLNK